MFDIRQAEENKYQIVLPIRGAAIHSSVSAIIETSPGPTRQRGGGVSLSGGGGRIISSLIAPLQATSGVMLVIRRN